MKSTRARKSTRRPCRAIRRRPMYRRRNPLPRAPTGSFATRSETFSATGTMGQVYDLNNITLSKLAVCEQIAQYYQYYRITSVQMRFKPNFDTFVAGGSSGTGVLPYLYFLYDKSGSLGSLSGPQFEECGAKPIRFDERTILRKWVPSVVTQTADASNGITQFKSSPWLPTFKSDGITANGSVNHLGAVWYISKINPADAGVYDVDITVTVQFKKPLAEAVAGAETSKPILEV